MTDIETKTDLAHSGRVMGALALAATPVWLSLLVTGFVFRSLTWSAIALVFILPPVVLYVTQVAHTGVCPSCGRRIRFMQRQDRYSSGNDYSYTCDNCNTSWRTNMWPGSDVS